MADCCSVEKKQPGLLKNKLFCIVAVLALVLLASYWIPFLEAFRDVFLKYVRIIFWPLALGLVIGGIIEYYVPKEYVSHILAGKKKRSIVYAVLWGFTMTLCCHGILALAVQLYKKGASPSSVVAFLLASPWANFPLTLMLVGFFGPAKAAYIVLSAILTALITGWIFQILERKGMVDINPNTMVMEDDFDLWVDIRQRARGYRFNLSRDLFGIIKGIKDLAEMTMWWLLIGMSLAAAAGAYVPGHLFQRFMGRSLTGLLVTLVVATLIETCSEGSSPLAFEIYRQSGALGNALVFLMAGVATDYTEIGLLWVTAGRRTALWMPVISVPIIVCLGWLANNIF